MARTKQEPPAGKRRMHKFTLGTIQHHADVALLRHALAEARTPDHFLERDWRWENKVKGPKAPVSLGEIMDGSPELAALIRSISAHALGELIEWRNTGPLFVRVDNVLVELIKEPRVKTPKNGQSARTKPAKRKAKKKNAKTRPTKKTAKRKTKAPPKATAKKAPRAPAATKGAELDGAAVATFCAEPKAISELEAKFPGLGRSTLRRRLGELVDAKKLDTTGLGRGARYVVHGWRAPTKG